jgi:hypothetical protein
MYKLIVAYLRRLARIFSLQLFGHNILAAVNRIILSDFFDVVQRIDFLFDAINTTINLRMQQDLDKGVQLLQKESA